MNRRFFATLTLTLSLFPLIAAAAGAAPQRAGDAVKKKPNPSQRLDAIIAKGLAANGQKPNPMTSDEIFVRRIYLDVIGRVPTVQEALAFFQNPAKNKRAALVDELLASEGYVHHFYSYWADLLRAKTQISGAGNSTTAGYAYHEWIKDALRQNKPYNVMVRELITAHGSTWDDGAVGYYLRDYNMPLDNLAVTTQLFLGTQIVCAQCHNHPFDSWTQMDYYHLSAFTFGQITSNRSENASAALRMNGKTMKDPDERRAMSRAMNEILKPLRFNNVNQGNRRLRLPGDYQYDDARPSAVVQPAVPWSEAPKSAKSPKTGGNAPEPPIEAFAAWLTAPENPRFTRVIANRLFKKAMGRGVIEPVDDLRDDTKPANPELMAFLENRMKAVGYDMKKFLRTIYLSKSYQREASPAEVQPWEPYHFAGPVLRRLSAEQIWDSLVAMIVDNVDNPSAQAALARERRITQTQWVAEGVYDHSPERILQFAKLVGKKQEELAEEIGKAQQKVAAARETEDAARISEAVREAAILRGKLAEMVAETVYKPGLEAKVAQAQAGEAEEFDDEFLRELATLVDDDGGLFEPETNMASRSNGYDGGSYIQGLMNQLFQPKVAALRAAETRRHAREMKAWGVQTQKQRQSYKSFVKSRKGLVRASEIRSPAPNGHFLREFGQSDRELIENANDQASITQALQLLNGRFNNMLLNGYSRLSRDMRNDKNMAERLDTIYLTMLSRKPTKEERDLLLPEMIGHGNQGLNQVVWALLNTRQFMFVQ